MQDHDGADSTDRQPGALAVRYDVTHRALAAVDQQTDASMVLFRPTAHFPGVVYIRAQATLIFLYQPSQSVAPVAARRARR
jgi:hypothetical protein